MPVPVEEEVVVDVAVGMGSDVGGPPSGSLVMQ
jgi:hypothetical protein